MSQGINGFMSLSAAQQFAQQRNSPRPFRENSFASSSIGLYQQQQQSPLVIPQPQINENLLKFMHPLCDGNTMIQVSQQFNQYGHPQSSHTPSKPQGLFALQGQEPVPLNIESIFKTPKRVDPNFKALCEMQEIANAGCESASKIYPAHSKRPYFKKIDLLCDRLRQDLRVTDKAVVNINSHGVAWAIKDFIFVFTRITSAWVIMRDYYYTKSDGMRCVKESLDPNLAKDFLEWQEATKKFTKSLMQSFENLHYRDQRNGNRKGNNSFDQGSNHSSPVNGSKSNSFSTLFDPLVVENSEKAQLEGGYLKSALYHPVSSSEESSPPSTPTSCSNRELDSIKKMLDELLPEKSFVEQKRTPLPLYQRCAEASPDSQSAVKSQYRMKTNLADKFESVQFDVEGILPIKMDDKAEESLFSFESLQKLYGIDGAKKITGLFNDVLKLRGAFIFMSPTESLKFFPALHFDNALSLEFVVSNIQNEKYPTIRDIFIALKMIAEQAKALLQYCSHGDQNTGEIIFEFVNGIELTLAKHA